MKKSELRKNLRTRRTGYRIRLKETDLFFTPSRTINNQYDIPPAYGTVKVKSNLSERGKIYSQYPNIGHCVGLCATHLTKEVDIAGRYYWKPHTAGSFKGWGVSTSLWDWEVEEYEYE